MPRLKAHPVFVYGTLRKNQESTHVLNGYRLYDLGRFPCIIAEEGHRVLGNVILVSDDELRQLDRVEGTAHGFYTRETVKVDNLSGNKGKNYSACYVYVAGNVLDYERPKSPIDSGDWHVHPSKQKHVFSPYL